MCKWPVMVALGPYSGLTGFTFSQPAFNAGEEATKNLEDYKTAACGPPLHPIARFMAKAWTAEMLSCWVWHEGSALISNPFNLKVLITHLWMTWCAVSVADWLPPRNGRLDGHDEVKIGTGRTVNRLGTWSSWSLKNKPNLEILWHIVTISEPSCGKMRKRGWWWLMVYHCAVMCLGLFI